MRGSIALPMSMLAMSCCLAESSLETHREESPQGSVIVEWNQLAYKIAFAEDQFRTFKGQRALAMMHLAQHDALNSITRRFEPYAAQGRRGSEAEPTAAAAQAARQVLIAQYPAAQSEIDALLAQQLASVAGDMRRKNLGIDLGRAAATAIGRDADDLRRTGLGGTPDQIVDRIGRFAELGASRVYLQVLDLDDLDHLAVLSDRVLTQVG